MLRKLVEALSLWLFKPTASPSQQAVEASLRKAEQMQESLTGSSGCGCG